MDLERKAKQQWDRDASLQMEFGDDFEAYLAYATAEAAGQVKICGQVAATEDQAGSGIAVMGSSPMKKRVEFFPKKDQSGDLRLPENESELRNWTSPFGFTKNFNIPLGISKLMDRPVGISEKAFAIHRHFNKALGVI